MVTVGQGMYALPVDHSEKLSDSIATSDVNSGCYMLFLFLFALLLFVCFIFLLYCLFFLLIYFFYFQGLQQDFYKYRRVQILCCYHSTSQIVKTFICKGLRQLTLISFQGFSESEAGLWISVLGFHCKLFAFRILYYQNF